MVEEGQNEPDFSLKRIRSEETRDEKDEDRISRLPDCLLVEILSRLDGTKCAVKTGALSKRWKHIWTLVPILIFLHRDKPSADFVSFVDKTLTQRGQQNLKKFSIYSTYNDRFEPQVRSWIHYAINCKVEKLRMMYWHTERPHWFLLDECCFFVNSYFTELKMSFCQFDPDGAISWEKLMRLHISHLSLDEELLENILSGSPALETLELKECFGFSRLNITSKSVKKFVFDEYLGNGDVIEINAPNILSLEIKSHLHLRKILLINVSSLVEVDLNYALSGDYEITRKEAEEEMLKACILKLLHVKEVRIGYYCLKALSRLEAKGFTFPSNLMVSDDWYDPFESESDSDDDSELSNKSNSDSDESRDSEVLLLDDGPNGDELQERVDVSSQEDDEDGDDENDA